MSDTNTDNPTPNIDTSTWGPTVDVDLTPPAWLIPNRLYDVLKWLAMLVFPALAVFTRTIGPAWGLPHMDAIATTLAALGVLCGAIIGISAINAHISSK
ncbi:phage holin [Bifidobacterium scardovii]|uniref:Phage holin-like protein n=1 Tax=Bifidobacterium scardovii TaxID=158787 RepID=A0A087DGL7_9BIFI|nr:phage holin [Bifidobacterium scardovii]KFI94667.1 phage holin-like protein [Bifidobacterium scardovii]MDK6350706.1 phage holin [Bifidobacterium scardovii]BAQ32100.1 conserved hypothetical protein [Bifidobacterium scardovii JCM 12489 = DSM 13734]